MTALGSLPITQKDSSSTPFGMMLNPASRFALLLDWRAVKLTAVTGSNGSKAGFHFVEKHCQNSSGFGGTGLAGHLAMDTKIHSQRATAPIRSENLPP